METQLEQIRDLQKKTWNQSSPGWRKWDELTMDFLKPVGDEIIQKLKPQGDNYVLDIAAGTGEPGLTIATMLNNGKVVITDLAEGMLEVARENAVKRGIKNVETIVCDVSELPFQDNMFDVISCRMGFMFFPDMLMAAKEMIRVLKPGGRIAASVWNGPDKNLWFTTAMSSVNRNMALPPPSPGTPGMFRCAEENLIADLFSKAGFKDISQKNIEGKLNCGTADVYWGFASEVVGPVVNSLSMADDPLRQKIKSEVYKTINDTYPDGKVAIGFSANVIYGEK
ncbi:ubiquinone/menaquinone biosynthesis C-methylase UbiE [Chryseobacterium sediminis]|uniref:Ubiquinone/menaquinone biosynthesis C-methylase UbiE n=1 Tax=Chryseobacterium sediminis TaxID=1679494 RepID=A0ABR6PYK5_9FLAO|nr:class I SAM-dependent methyltransferase [Chryseobacterium sediminis]MBB6330684.1 ubiquinone/menaquinone biosynthesis C-methylase UbiE [Chryseobacterium sediminis]